MGTFDLRKVLLRAVGTVQTDALSSCSSGCLLDNVCTSFSSYVRDEVRKIFIENNE